MPWQGVAYCEECWTEFVDGVPQCSDCGGPLRAGPLPDEPPMAEQEGGAAGADPELAGIDSLVGEFPGEDAEYLAEALRMEGIHSRLECGGIVRHRGPGQKATGPISLSLPVRVFVAEAELERAGEIRESISHDDLVGDAWAEGADAPEFEDPAGSPGSAVPADHAGPPLEMRAEGTSSRVAIVLLLAAAVGLLFMFAR